MVYSDQQFTSQKEEDSIPYLEMHYRKFLQLGTVLLVTLTGYLTVGLTMRADISYVVAYALSDETRQPFRFVAWQYLSVTDRVLNDVDGGAKPLITYVLNYHSFNQYRPSRSLEMARVLVDRGVDVNERSSAGHTPLHNAILANEPEVVSFLVLNGASRELTSPTKIKSSGEVTNLAPLHYAEYLNVHSLKPGEWSQIISLLRNSPQS